MKLFYTFIAYTILIASSINVKAQFVEKAIAVGVDHKYTSADYIGGGVAIFDINNDNLLDLFIVGGRLSDAIYINSGNGFDKNVVYLGIDDIDYYNFEAIGVAVGDVNNDGFDDLFLCTNKDDPNLLLINNQNNTFDAIPDSVSGIVEKAWSVSASFGDVNKDGFLDIYVANYVEEIKVGNDSLGNIDFNHTGYTNYLYINNGDNTFTERSGEYGINIVGTSLATAFTDFDNDNDVDVYIANDFGAYIEPNELYENEYPMDELSDISESSGANIGLFGMGIAIGDYDNDLDLDYYVTNLGKNELLQNNDDQTFDMVTNAAMVGDSAITGGLAVGWGTGFIDYNNNGWLDLFVSNGFIPAASEIDNPHINPNAFFRNNEDGTFTDVSNEMGILDSGFCRGAAYGDLDNDGDLDLIFIPANRPGITEINIREKVEVYYNETELINNWVKLKMKGTESNRNAYGTHVLLHDTDGKSQLREVDGGSSHASSNTPIVHFGLGGAEIDSIEIFWINGMYQVVRNLEKNMQYLITEGINQMDTVISNIDDNVDNYINVYPNPVHSKITVNLNYEFSNSSQLSYKVFSLSGKMLKQSEIKSTPFNISLEDISRQELLLNIFDGNRLIGTTEISKL